MAVPTAPLGPALSRAGEPVGREPHIGSIADPFWKYFDGWSVHSAYWIVSVSTVIDRSGQIGKVFRQQGRLMAPLDSLER